MINALTMPINLLTADKKTLQVEWRYHQLDIANSHTQPQKISIEKEVTPKKWNEVMDSPQKLHYMTIPEEQRSEYEEFIKRLSIIQIPQEIHETYIEMKFHYWTLEFVYFMLF
uniref:Uncharacterized protein n=1 Tax=Sipha flava TaxID=143950 RepID=A0A2S2QZB2_9HEMI